MSLLVYWIVSTVVSLFITIRLNKSLDGTQAFLCVFLGPFVAPILVLISSIVYLSELKLADLHKDKEGKKGNGDARG